MQAPLLVTPAEPRQRLRLAYGRSADAPRLAQRDQLSAWEQALVASGLPMVGLDQAPPRPRIVFAAPLAVGIAAERELADLFLTQRTSVADVREALERHLPAGHGFVGLHDVWLGAPALPGQVAAADYRARIVLDAGPGGGDAALEPRVLSDAADRLLAAANLPRTRDKGGRAVAYDLRPLVAGLEVHAVPDPEMDGAIADLRVRVRFDPERGVGRPEEVLAAIAESVGAALSFVSLIRERIVLTGGD